MPSPGRHSALRNARDQGSRRWLAVAVAGLFFARVAVATRMKTLISLPDEIGFLGDAWLLGRGRPAPPMQFSPPYKVGYPIVLAPIAHFISDPDHLQFAALVVNAIALAALVPVLMRVVAKLEPIPRRTLLLVAVAAACLPATWIAGIFAWPDALDMLVIAAALLGLWALAVPGPLWQRVWFGPAMAWLWVSHDRFLPTLLLAALVLVVRIIFPPTPADPDEGASARDVGSPVEHRFVSILNLAGLVVVAVAGWALNKWVYDVRWGSVYTGTFDGLGIGDTRLVLQALIGEVWYAICSTYGLAAIGVFALVQTAVRAARRGRALWCEPLPLVAGFIVLFLGALEVAAALQLRKPSTFNLLANGRYQEVVIPVVAAVGLARLVTWARDRSAIQPLTFMAVGTVLLGGVLGIMGKDITDVASTNLISGIGWYSLRTPSAPVVGPMLAFLVGLVGLVLLARWRPALMVAMVIVVFSLVGAHEALHTTRDSEQVVPTEAFADQVRRLDVGPAVEYTAEAGLYQSFQVGWRLAGIDVQREDTGSALPVVITGGKGTGVGPGARLAVVSSNGILQAWVRPGPLQNRLAAEGQLYPAFPQAVPPADAKGVVIPDRSTVGPKHGGTVVTVTVSNQGTGTIWPAPGLVGRSAVTLVATATGVSPVQVRLPEIRPGQSAKVQIDLAAMVPADAQSRVVRLFVYQPGARFTPTTAWPDVTVDAG